MGHFLGTFLVVVTGEGSEWHPVGRAWDAANHPTTHRAATKAWPGPQSAWCKAEKSVLAGGQGEESLGRRDGGRQKRKDTVGSRDTPETDVCVSGGGGGFKRNNIFSC